MKAYWKQRGCNFPIKAPSHKEVTLKHKSGSENVNSMKCKKPHLSMEKKKVLLTDIRKIWMTGLQAKAIVLMQNHKANLGTGFDSLNYSQDWVPCSAFHCLIVLKRYFP